MNLLKDKKIIALIVILVVFTIGYFIAVNKVSYAFSNDINVEDSYNILIDTVKKCAIAYANNNESIFGEEKTAYIKVQDLIDNGYIATNEDGNISNPLNKDDILNTKIIKIKKDADKIEVEVDS